MSTKKRKATQDDAVAADHAGDLNHRDPAAESKPQRQTLYFPIMDDPPPAVPPPIPAAVAAAGVPEEDEDEAEDEDDVDSLLQPLTREQLVSLLRAAATSDPATLAAIRREADSDPAHRKLFVHGLGWTAGDEDLRAAFARYGELEDCRVIIDKGSGRSKGYGFVLFRERRSASRALRRPQKTIAGRLASCHLAAAGPAGSQQLQNPNQNPVGQMKQSLNSNSNHSPSVAAPPNQSDNLLRKIFVGNVHADVDVDRLYSFFSQYGEIEEGPLGFDRNTGKPKGFALFVYKTVEGARRALEEPMKNFDGKTLNCQKAIDGRAGKSVSAVSNTPNAVTATVGATTSVLNTVPNAAGIDASAYGGIMPDMAYAQQAAMLAQGLAGMGGQQAFGLGMQPNTAMLAMMAAAMQNPAMLAAVNPALAAAALSAGAQQVMPVTAGQTAASAAAAAALQGFGAQGFTAQGFGTGAATGYQSAGTQAYQGPPGFQGASGFPATQQGAQQAGAGTSGYQGGAVGQGQLTNSQLGHMSGY